MPNETQCVRKDRYEDTGEKTIPSINRRSSFSHSLGHSLTVDSCQHVGCWDLVGCDSMFAAPIKNTSSRTIRPALAPALLVPTA